MPDDNINPATTSIASSPTKPVSNSPVSDSVIVDPNMPDMSTMPEPTNARPSDISTEVVHKINESQNVLIALSSDPSVDEMAAAIGLSLFLDKIGKRATAIYSGSTPNALEFLKPEETFESTADALQDFVIALNKEKADHLRYKLDGDFVKIYITPYKARIDEEDLDFSYGDFNVDLVLALDVANGVDLDSALREHGRIMHNASIINITTGNPGKLGEIEWSDKSASSVSEMVAKLLYSMKGKAEIEKEEATAFLTGIVAATNRFSNASTTPETMKISSRLMESGANQQLISENITPDVENEMLNMMSGGEEKSKEDPTSLDIEHEDIEEKEAPKEAEGPKETKTGEEPESNVDEPDLMEDLKAAEASLAQVGDKTLLEQTEKPLKIDSENADNINIELPQVDSFNEATPKAAPESSDEPSIELGAEAFNKEDNGNKYGQMLEEALGNNASAEPTMPIISPSDNPATAVTPDVPNAPEINGVPEINYSPAVDEDILPPPPAPPIDMDMPVPAMTTPTTSTVPETPATPEPIMPATPKEAPKPEPLGSQPAMQDQVYTPQASDPSAFKIPGM